MAIMLIIKFSFTVVQGSESSVRNTPDFFHASVITYYHWLGKVVGLWPIVRLWDLDLEGEYPPWGSF